MDRGGFILGGSFGGELILGGGAWWCMVARFIMTSFIVQSI